MKTFYNMAVAVLMATTLMQSTIAAEKDSKIKEVKFKASKVLLCGLGQPIEYTNQTEYSDDKDKDKDKKYDLTHSYLWTFEGGTPSTFLGENPPKIAYKSAGTFKTTLLVQSSNEKGELLGKYEKVMLIVVQNPVINLGADKTICSGEVIILDAGMGLTKYRWINAENNGKLGDESKLIVNTNGNYKITAETPAGCEASDEIKISPSTCTGTENKMGNANISLYPNPAKDIINVTAKFDVASDMKIVIVNSTGVEVSSQNLPTTTEINTPVNISNLSSGLYRVNYFVNGVLAKSMPLMIQ